MIKIQHIQITFFLALFAASSISWSQPTLNLAVDDSKVIKDIDDKTCTFGLCNDSELDEHFLSKRIYHEFKQLNKYTINESRSNKLHDGLLIEVKSTSMRGRGYVQAASSLLTLGTAPVRSPYKFNVRYVLYQKGVPVAYDGLEFKQERNESILADTQKYKIPAAHQIVQFASMFLERTLHDDKYLQTFWDDHNTYAMSSQAQVGFLRNMTPYKTISSKEPRGCVLSCMRDKRCNSWNYSKKGFNDNTTHTCQLLEDAPDPVKDPCCLTGYRNN